MAEPFEWRCEFYDGTDWRVLPDIQSVNMFRGRRLQIDDYAADVATIRSLFPTDWTYTPKLGDRVLIYIYKPGVVTSIDEFACFWGNIRDVDIDYGFVDNMDTVTVSCEGLQADWGRAQLNGFSLAEDTTDEQVLQVGSQVGLNVAQFFGRSIASAQTYTGNAFDLINTLTRTEEARMFAAAASFKGTESLYWFGRNRFEPTTYNFNDGTGTPQTTQLKYEGIRFRSSADNFYNQVTITPLSVAAQVAGGVTTPIFGLQKDTLDFSTGQADDHAEWLLANFATKDSTLAEITLTDVQQGPRISPIGAFNTDMIFICSSAIATQARIAFRGDVYNTIIEGIQISATPQQTRVTLFMSGQDNNAYLILDNAIYGKLDENNKYGF